MLSAECSQQRSRSFHIQPLRHWYHSGWSAMTKTTPELFLAGLSVDLALVMVCYNRYIKASKQS